MLGENQTRILDNLDVNYTVPVVNLPELSKADNNTNDELRALLLEIQKKISQALELLSGRQVKIMPPVANLNKEISGRVIEGVFDGQNMVGQDGKEYTIPANYASKSKLVEGDMMKLTIAESGAFVYKQIGPIARRRVIGKLHQNGGGEYSVVNEEGEWKVLPASITYFKGMAGDETAILVPQNTPSKWAAVENVIKGVI